MSINELIKTRKETNILNTQVIRENKINTQIKQGPKTQVKNKGIQTAK